MPKGPTGYCPKCGHKMRKRPVKVKRKILKEKKDPVIEIPDTAYVCPGCKGVFIPESIFAVH